MLKIFNLFYSKTRSIVRFFRFLDLNLSQTNALSKVLLTKNKISNKSYFFFDRKNKETTHRTLIKGPGAKLNIIESKKPKRDMTSPNIEDRTIAIHKDGACCKPNKVGVDSKAITRMTPTADMELTITSAVVKPRAKFKKETLTPLEAAPSGSNPI